MTAQSQLEAYLGEFRRRLRSLIVARGAAVLTAVALAVTLVAVYIGTRRAFDPDFIYGARTVLALLLAGVAIALVARPLRSLKRTRGIGDIERRAPDFNGRLETYDGLTHSDRPTPFLTLLAEDALKLARRIPVALKIPSRQISVPTALAVLAVGALVWFAAFGPDNWRYGVRHLWAGWLFSDTLPPQRIAVLPGDGTVRRGGDLTIEAQAEGFDPTSMEVYALFAEGGNWESAPMDSAQNDAFDFTFFAVREPLRYYVTAAGVRSPEYAVEVVDLPRISNVKLTYHYPNWTKLEPLIEDPGSDITAVEGTQVTVELQTDQPLNAPELVANGERVAMEANGNVSTATLEVTKEGEYFVSTLFNSDAVKVTDDYLISVTPDNKPVVKVVKPGRDWRASNIEEVLVRVEASDDFGLDKVEVRYSVNGGEWQSAPLPVEGNQATGEETLFLENMRQPVRQISNVRAQEPTNLSPFRVGPNGIEEFRVRRPRPVQEEPAAPAEQSPAGAEAAAPQERTLEPGDVISYYAVAEDRGREVQTDLFFVEVQPFDRSFSQATAGGGGGGGGGQQQDEISRRQKEILVATWNLIRERTEGTSSYLDEQQLHDNSQMLADLQRTLAEQARTLASRARARQLTGVDERIQQFVQALEQAATAMGPAAERLADIELDNAVPPEQEALQHLLRAESVFTDIQVAFQQGGGGGGGLAGRDLSELFELEMDLEKNQYETEAPVAFDSPEQEVDEAIAKLQELARRQEALANQANRRNGLTEQERWQQESLRRETEELKRQLEQMQQQLAQAQQQQQQQAGEQGQEQQQGQSGQQPQSGQPGQGQSQGSQTDQAIAQLNQALENMNRAGSQGQNMDPEQARRAIEQARRELQQALEQLTAQRQEAVGEAYSDLAERSEQVYEEQRRVAQELQEALRENANNPSLRSGRRSGGLPDDQAQEFAERKDALQQELEALERDIERVAQQFRDQTPGASQELRDAFAELQAMQTSARLGYGAEAIRRGASAQVAGTESVTTSALRDLQRNTEAAQELANQEAVAGEQFEPDPNAELVAELQSLRRQLAELTQQQQQQLQQQQLERGQDGQQGQEQGQQAGTIQISSRQAVSRPAATTAGNKQAATSAVARLGRATGRTAVRAASTTRCSAACGIRAIWRTGRTRRRSTKRAISSRMRRANS